MRDKVLRYIRDRGLMRAGDRVCVAVSGGADSVALLRVLLELRAELGIVLSVAHFNHLLRGEDSEADQAFTAALAEQHALPFFTTRGAVPNIAACRKKGLEETARELRYAWLHDIGIENRLGVIATAHTLDDQAETVLMKFLRGAGTRGLGGIYPEVNLAANAPDFFEPPDDRREGPPEPGGHSSRHTVRLARPLLGTTRAEVESWLASLGQDWREDTSNLDGRFTRNRVRHELLPLLERDYNPNLRQVLSETAEVARAEEEYWESVAARELAARVRPSASRLLHLEGLGELPLALRRRVLKGFVESAGGAADFEHIQNLLRCAAGEIDSTILPGDWLVSRQGDCLRILDASYKQSGSDTGREYSYRLSVPGTVYLEAIGLTLQAKIVRPSEAEAQAPGTLLVASALAAELTVRNWRPGDRYWPAHAGSEVKLKRLFSEAKVPENKRATWPVVLSGDHIAWVRGFLVARQYAWRPGKGDAVKVEELG